MGTHLIKLFAVDIFINYFQPHFFSLSPNIKGKRKKVNQEERHKTPGHIDKTKKSPSCQN